MAPHHKGAEVDFSARKDSQGKVKIYPKELDIIWGSDGRYWRLPERDDGPVELLQVCWLEVTGSLKNVESNKDYQVLFNVSTKPDAFGWSDSPVYLMVKIGDKYTWQKADLSQLKKNPDKIPYAPLKFKVTGDEKVSFGLYEIWRGRWKGGLLIHEVIIEPVANK